MRIIAMDSTANTHRYVWEYLRENVTLRVSFVTLHWKLFSSTSGEGDSPNNSSRRHGGSAPSPPRTLFVLRGASRSVDGETGSISFNGTWFGHLNSRSARQKKKHHELSRSYIRIMNRSSIWAQNITSYIYLNIYLNRNAGQFRV